MLSLGSKQVVHLLVNRWIEEDAQPHLHALLLLLDCMAFLSLTRSSVTSKDTSDIWETYVKELYLPSNSIPSSTDPSWHPPLSVDFATTVPFSAQSLAATCLVRLEAAESTQQLLQSTEPICADFDLAFYRHLGQAVGDLRARSRDIDFVDLEDMLRSILSSVLDHHCGPEHFAVASPIQTRIAAGESTFRRVLAGQAAAVHDVSRAHKSSRSDSEISTLLSSSKSSHDGLGDILDFSHAANRKRAMSSGSGASGLNIRVSTQTVSHTDDTSTLRSSRSYSSTAHLLRPQSLLITPTSVKVKSQEKMPTAPSSPAPFSNNLVSVESSPVEVKPNDSSLPPTINDLSPSERRDMIKRSKKLQQRLGIQLDEDSAKRALVPRKTDRGVSDSALPSPDLLDNFDGEASPTIMRIRRRNRSQSFPPPSPTSPVATSRLSEMALRNQSELNRSTTDSMLSRSSSGGLISATDATTSPEMSNKSPITPFEFQSFSSPWRLPPTADEVKLKEERRRRVQKVYTLLGEYVPVELVLGPNSVQPISTPTTRPKHARTPSRFEQASGAITRKFGMLKKRSKETDSFSSDEDWQAVPFQPQPPILANSADGTLSIDALRRARKLERLLGELPPQHLNPTRYKGMQPYRASFDTVSIAGDEDDGFHTLPNPVDLLDGRRSSEPTLVGKTSKSSLRRTSIAALQLQYLAENQPDVLEKTLSEIYRAEKELQIGQIAHEVEDEAEDEDEELGEDDGLNRLSFLTEESYRLSGTPSSRMSGFTYVDESAPATATDGAFDVRPRSSSDGQRHLRKAAKLAKFFGTTKGEVLSKVLEDLENEIEDDMEATIDERAATLVGVRRLRQSLIA